MIPTLLLGSRFFVLPYLLIPAPLFKVFLVLMLCRSNLVVKHVLPRLIACTKLLVARATQQVANPSLLPFVERGSLLVQVEDVISLTCFC